MLFFAFLFIIDAHGQDQNPKQAPRICPLIFSMNNGNEKQAIVYAANKSLSTTDTSVKKLVIYMQGVKRNALDYFEYAVDAAKAANVEKQTLVIAPQFLNESDLDFYHLDNSYLYWKRNEWKDGFASGNGTVRVKRVKISSYEVLDELVMAIIQSKTFPNLNKVVIAGHSAGGQFVQRYSAITPLPNVLPKFSFRFVVMNPSSYLYLDTRRPVLSAKNEFAVPDSGLCPGYNQYPKGLERLNRYAADIGPTFIKQNMLHRDIMFLLGGDDVRMDDPELDVSCNANLEGRYRLERGLNFMAYLHNFPEYKRNNAFAVVAGVAHDAKRMIASKEARKWIFDWM